MDFEQLKQFSENSQGLRQTIYKLRQFLEGNQFFGSIELEQILDDLEYAQNDFMRPPWIEPLPRKPRKSPP